MAEKREGGKKSNRKGGGRKKPFFWCWWEVGRERKKRERKEKHFKIDCGCQRRKDWQEKGEGEEGRGGAFSKEHTVPSSRRIEEDKRGRN